MVVRKVSEFRALELQSLMKAAQLGGSLNTPGVEKILACDGAMMVDLLNSDPYVFVMPDTVHIFKSAPGSGTDHLRQRIKAEKFFHEVAEGLDIDRQRSRQGVPCKI